MIRDSENGVHVKVLETTDGYTWAEIDVARHPEGTVKHELSPTELKHVADMLYATAEKMEDKDS